MGIRSKNEELIHDQIRRAMEQYREAENIIQNLQQGIGITKELDKMIEGSIKQAEKELEKIEKELYAKTEEQLKTMEKAGINLSQTPFFKDSFMEATVCGTMDITPEEAEKLTNEELMNCLHKAKDEARDAAAEYRHGSEISEEVKRSAKEIEEKAGKEIDAETAENKLTENEAKLTYAREIETDAKELIKDYEPVEQFKKENNLTEKDLSEYFSYSAEKEKNEKWKALKDEFSKINGKIHKGIADRKAFNQVKHIECERQMNMRILSVKNAAADKCELKIQRLMSIREKIVGTIDKAAHLGNDTANKIRDILGYDTKEMGHFDVDKIKLFDEKIKKIEIIRMKYLKDAAKLVLKNNELTKQEKEISGKMMEKARNRTYKKNMGVVNRAKGQADKDRETVSNEAARNSVMFRSISGDIKQTGMTSNNQVMYNLNLMVNSKEVREHIINQSRTEENTIDQDKVMALAVLHKAGADIRNENYINRTAEDVLNESDKIICQKDNVIKKDIANMDKYMDNVEKNPEEAIKAIAKDIEAQKEREAAEVIKNDVIIGKDGKEQNLYIVALSPQQAAEIVKCDMEQRTLSSGRDEDFLNRVDPERNPSYASLSGGQTSYKIFTRPSEAVKFADAVNRVTGMDVKAMGNTQQATQWLTNIAKEGKYSNVDKDTIDKNIIKVQNVDKENKNIKFKDDDELCL